MLHSKPSPLRQEWLDYCRDVSNPLPTFDGSIPDLRASIASLVDAGRHLLPDHAGRVRIESTTFAASDGHEVEVRIYAPLKRREDRAVCGFFHGGGFAFGDLDVENAVCLHLALDTGGMVVISVEMRLAPEHPHPRPFLDCYEAMEWIHANHVPIVSTPFYLAGSSAGANLAAAVTLYDLHHLDHRRRVAGLLLYNPVLDLTNEAHETDSWQRFKYGPVVSERGLLTLRGIYNPATSHHPWSDARLSPLHTTADNLCRHPPTFIVTASHDPLRDQGLKYAELLTTSSVPVMMHEFEGLPHAFWWAPIAQTQAEFYLVQKEAVSWLTARLG